jgi:hypothetical protein
MFKRPYGTDPMAETWDGQKNELKRKFPDLTDDDLNFEGNNIQEMIARLQVKLRKTQEELYTIMASL